VVEEAASTRVPFVGVEVDVGMESVWESEGLTIVLGRAVGVPVGAWMVLLGDGYG
jgi:hypothetical protein